MSQAHAASKTSGTAHHHAAPKSGAQATPKATAPGRGGAALAVARASVSQVVLAHDLAVGASHLSGAPPGIGAPQAAELARLLTSEAHQLGAAASGGKPTDVSNLVTALTGYAGLANQLARRPATDTAHLSKAFVATLRTLDAKWRPAVTAIGTANHVNLLTKLAPLLIPPSA